MDIHFLGDAKAEGQRRINARSSHGEVEIYRIEFGPRDRKGVRCLGLRGHKTANFEAATKTIFPNWGSWRLIPAQGPPTGAPGVQSLRIVARTGDELFCV